MTVAFDFIADSREKNQRIKEINEEILRYDNNTSHLLTLEEECSQTNLESSYLAEQWEKDYVPAINRRQKIQSELKMATSDPEGFKSVVCQGLGRRSIPEIEAVIEKIQHRTSWTVIDLSGENDGNRRGHDTNSMRSSDGKTIRQSFQRRKSEEIVSSFTVLPKKKSDELVRRMRHRSWSLSSAQQKSQVLEKIHEEIAQKKRSIGNRTCQLAATSKSLQDQVATLNIAMSTPAYSLYSSSESQSRPHKIKCYQAYLAECKRDQHNRRSYTSRSSITFFNPPDKPAIDLAASRKYAVSDSVEDTIASLNDISIETSTTDLSQLGIEASKGF